MAATYDAYNKIEEKVVDTLQADSLLGASGALEIASWLEEHPGSAEELAEIPGHLLPCISVECNLQGQQVVTIGDRLENRWLVNILLIMSGAVRKEVKKNLKQHAARIEYVLQQQHLPDLQMTDLPDDILGGVDGSLQAFIEGTQLDTGRIENSMAIRGIAEIECNLIIEIDMPEVT